MDKQIVVFELVGEHYAVNIAAVESIIKMQAITRLPQAPAYMEGVINLRGKVLPVIDLHKRFGLADQHLDKDSRIIVVNMAETEVGMIVDGVSEVLTISDQAVEPAPAMAHTVNSTFITGIAKIDQRLVILLDLAKVLSADQQAELVAVPGSMEA